MFSRWYIMEGVIWRKNDLMQDPQHIVGKLIANTH